ncbi:DUF1016 domain-containing protein [Burkholderia sp. MS455]|uniref:DUF1016 N-terminal domain-containing protein n=1 Tax=Burkholderia sp. MS455 TaxID=2811788 RepID=UPI001956C0B5|nr:DUF1016 N-terminal domain-containing protein [Burkholderia sp. MS455]QRR05913.1 DUF1016 domain-containing protein [Burkholderia sp. MS455]
MKDSTSARQRAALDVNRELVLLYWQIGRDILRRRAEQGYREIGARAQEGLRGVKGSSRANLMSMRSFSDAWPDAAIVQQAVGQLPWGHNLVLLVTLKQPEQCVAYTQRLRYA